MVNELIHVIWTPEKCVRALLSRGRGPQIWNDDGREQLTGTDGDTARITVTFKNEEADTRIFSINTELDGLSEDILCIRVLSSSLHSSQT